MVRALVPPNLVRDLLVGLCTRVPKEDYLTSHAGMLKNIYPTRRGKYQLITLNEYDVRYVINILW